MVKHLASLFVFFRNRLLSSRFFDKIVLDASKKLRGDDREAEGNALLMRRMATPYRGFESLSLRKKNRNLLGLVGLEPTTPCVGNTDSKSTELQA